MPIDTFILAAADDVTKVLFAAVFFLIWIASAAMSQLAKRQEKLRREQVRREVDSTQKNPRKSAQPRQQSRPAPKMPAKPVVRRPAPPVHRPARTSSPVPIEAIMQPVIASKVAAQKTHTPDTKRRSIAPTAAALNGWLRPETLRKQFILTEILQPPLALRDNHLK